jgi:hypothetical protein
MANELDVRHYSGWSHHADQEITATAAAELPLYARGLYHPDGRLDRTELYYHGKPRRVDYYAVDDYAEVSGAHRQTYGDVPFTIREVVSVVQGLTWESARAFSAHGDPEGGTTGLLDSLGRALMQVEMEENGHIRGIEKYYWSPSGDLRYAVRYDGRGQFSSAHDFQEGKSVSLAEFMGDVPDPEFFRQGLNLPRTLAGTQIPDPR